MGGLNRVLIRALQCIANFVDGCLEVAAFVRMELIACVLERLFALVGEVVRVVAGFHAVLCFPVFLRVKFGFALHTLHFVFAESAGSGDGDFLFFPGTKVLSGNVQNAVCIDVESDLDLRGAARCWSDTVEVECSELLVVACHGAFPLEHLDFHARLVVAVGRENLRLAGWYGGVSRNHGRCHFACGFDGECERRDVEEEHVFHVTTEDATLNGCADGNDLVRVYAFVRFFPDELACSFDDARHARHSSDEDEFVDLVF